LLCDLCLLGGERLLEWSPETRDSMREMTVLSGVLREGCWIAGCIAAAAAFWYFAPEYGQSLIVVSFRRASKL
jgi:hypothetical protein